ncbi:GmrSD restriction endonuclease domain-containing protein [Aeromicrobium stalagmiti]|uniref:GmrSD restriction endonuclease domain-containing protein n=1 Tax=Aeromicrobium stalagmiti TaxID=2738988 RepID=UPI001C2C5A43
MKTDVVTPMQIFNLPQHFVVPLFQRPYVWEEEEQWYPLWADVRRIAELRIAEPHRDAHHFLGAVVLQAQEGAVHVVQARNVIDGQQRLTTLQILMDAASATLDESGQDRLASQLERYTHNSELDIPPGDERLKIRHSNRDQGAYDEVMSADIPVAYDALQHHGTRIVRAHRFFSGASREWLGSPEEDLFKSRATALVWVLTQGLQLVAIDLTAQENSQEIFETLNARGTPLTAADLIRNFVFQRLDSEGGDTAKAYEKDWPFESTFWEEQVGVGKQYIGRSSLFLNQWLVSRTGDEISPSSTFTRFKHYVEHESNLPMADLLPLIKEEADSYEQWVKAAKDSARQLGVVEMAVYRMTAAQSQVLMPLLIWLHQPGRNLDAGEIGQIVTAAESWLIRRVLMRQALGGEMGRTIESMIKAYDHVPAPEVADRVVAHLSRLNVTSTYWPGDHELRRNLEETSAYNAYLRARLRIVLEAVEDSYRRKMKESQLERKGYPIEHILPQSWEAHWAVAGDEAVELRRSRVHRLGNLTLLTAKLNSTVSNSNWSKKRKALLKHNTIKLTGLLVERTEDRDWDETLIDARTTELIEAILKIWPVPAGHTGEVVDPKSKSNDWVKVKDLVESGLISIGAVLRPGYGEYKGLATVARDGGLELDGESFKTPSGAAKHATGRPTVDGWRYWRLDDGRSLKDVRASFTGVQPEMIDLDERGEA